MDVGPLGQPFAEGVARVELEQQRVSGAHVLTSRPEGLDQLADGALDRLDSDRGAVPGLLAQPSEAVLGFGDGPRGELVDDEPEEGMPGPRVVRGAAFGDPCGPVDGPMREGANSPGRDDAHPGIGDEPLARGAGGNRRGHTLTIQV